MINTCTISQQNSTKYCDFDGISLGDTNKKSFILSMYDFLFIVNFFQSGGWSKN